MRCWLELETAHFVACENCQRQWDLATHHGAGIVSLRRRGRICRRYRICRHWRWAMCRSGGSLLRTLCPAKPFLASSSKWRRRINTKNINCRADSPYSYDLGNYTQSELFSGEQTSPLRAKQQHCQCFDTLIKQVCPYHGLIQKISGRTSADYCHIILRYAKVLSYIIDILINKKES